MGLPSGSMASTSMATTTVSPPTAQARRSPLGCSMRTSAMRAPRRPNEAEAGSNSKISTSVRCPPAWSTSSRWSRGGAAAGAVACSRRARRVDFARCALRGLEQVLEVELAHVLGRPDRLDAPAVEPEHAVAQARDRARVVAHEQQRPALLEFAQEAHALLHEARVADGERLVDHEDFRVDVRHDGEREPHDHAGRVGLDRLLDEVADVGERADGVEPRFDLLLRQADDVAVEEDVLAPAELGAEARAQFEDGRDAAVRRHAAGGGLQRAADDLQQRRLAGAVAADDADGLAAPDVEADVGERREFPVILALAAGEELLQPVARRRVEAVVLRRPLRRGRRGQRTSAKPSRACWKSARPSHATARPPTVIDGKPGEIRQVPPDQHDARLFDEERHRIPVDRPAEVLGHRAGRIEDRAQEHHHRGHDVDRLRQVAQVHAQRRERPREAEDEQDQRQQHDEDQRPRHRQRAKAREHDERQHAQADQPCGRGSSTARPRA